MKLSNMIEYPVNNFSINPYMNETTTKFGTFSYNLYAVSNHIGGINGGHYYSFVKSLTDNKWYCLDDESVTLIENENQVISQNAYILFYKLNQ